MRVKGGKLRPRITQKNNCPGKPARGGHGARGIPRKQGRGLSEKKKKKCEGACRGLKKPGLFTKKGEQAGERMCPAEKGVSQIREGSGRSTR